MKWLRTAFLTLLVCSATASAAELQRTRPQQPTSRTVVVYSGAVDGTTADRFLEVISANTDSVIGLNVTVEMTPESEPGYGASFSEGRLVVSSGDPMNAPQEVVINGPVGTTMGLTRVDGFYLIKSGGMHAAGALSWGAMPVDEASLRLNPYVRIVHRSF